MSRPAPNYRSGSPLTLADLRDTPIIAMQGNSSLLVSCTRLGRAFSAFAQRGGGNKQSGILFWGGIQIILLNLV